MRICSFLSVTFLLLTGCTTTKQAIPAHTARFYIESHPHLPPKWSQTITLPISGIDHSIYPEPVISEKDIEQVDLAKVDLGQCLSFQLTPSGTQTLYQLSAEHPGECLFLLIDNKPVGFRLIDTPIVNGHIMIFTEALEKNLPMLLNHIRLATSTPISKKIKI